MFSSLNCYSSVSSNSSNCACTNLIHLSIFSNLTHSITFTTSVNSRPIYTTVWLLDIFTCISSRHFNMCETKIKLLFFSFSPKRLHSFMFSISKNVHHFPGCQKIYETVLISLFCTTHIGYCHFSCHLKSKSWIHQFPHFKLYHPSTRHYLPQSTCNGFLLVCKFF